MTVLTSLGRALAFERALAQPITTVRHVHVSERPLVLIPLKMAGEANAPMAAMIGTDRSNPQLLVVTQPRNRDQRFAFAHRLARTILAQILPMAVRRIPPPSEPAGTVLQCADAPQIWVPNQAGIEFVRMLGRSTRFRKTTGPWKVPLNVPRMGKWLTFYADRAEYPGSSLLVAATAVLSQHWATGQSAQEDEHLGAILAWIRPPAGLTGIAAAQVVEDPVAHPPAGPATDPTFDNTVLAPLIRRHHANALNAAEVARIESRMTSALRGQLAGTWQRMWQAIDLLREFSPGAHVSLRWQRDLASFTQAAEWIAASPFAQRKRDTAVVAAGRLYDLERHQASYNAQRAFDDPLVMAEARIVGEAFAGTVVAAEPTRRVGRRKAPQIVVETSDLVRLAEGEAGLRSAARPRQKAELLSVSEVGGRLLIELELTEGMGRGREPEPGTVPAVGEEICYSLFADDFKRWPPLPPPEETPWTHGGPPTGYLPTDEDAREEWT